MVGVVWREQYGGSSMAGAVVCKQRYVCAVGDGPLAPIPSPPPPPSVCSPLSHLLLPYSISSPRVDVWPSLLSAGKTSPGRSFLPTTENSLLLDTRRMGGGSMYKLITAEFKANRFYANGSQYIHGFSDVLYCTLLYSTVPIPYSLRTLLYSTVPIPYSYSTLLYSTVLYCTLLYLYSYCALLYSTVLIPYSYRTPLHPHNR
jgi:hypothetical protein